MNKILQTKTCSEVQAFTTANSLVIQFPNREFWVAVSKFNFRTNFLESNLLDFLILNFFRKLKNF